MASSDILGYIHSALLDSEWWMNTLDDDDFRDMRISLRTLKAFVVGARKLPDHEGLGSLLVRVEDSIRKMAEELHACCLACLNDVELHDEDDSDFDDSHGAIDVATRFRNFMYGLVDEIKKWYVAMLDCSPRSRSLTANEVLEIISAVIENIADKRSLNSQYGEQDMFLKSLIQFVDQGVFEACENLLAHAEGVAINFAYLLFRDRYDHDESVSSEMSMLLQKFRPVDHRVCEIYTGALTSSKLSGKSHGSAAMKNFLDSLISNLWEILRRDTVSYADQLKGLFEGLRSLRSEVFIKQPRASFDEMHIEKNIAHLVCDAGIYLCSFYQPRTGDDLELQRLLESLLVEVGDKGQNMLNLNNSPKPSSYAYVDFILEKLMELTSCKAESTGMRHVETILEELETVRSLLGKVVELRDEQMDIQSLWDRLLEVAYEVEDDIDRQHCLSTSFDSFMTCIGKIKAGALKIEVKDERRQSIVHAPSTSPSMSNEVVGFCDEERRIIDHLRGGSQHLEIISIVGMPGLGKTTLATKVFNDPSNSCHFKTSAWCPISQQLDKKNVLLNLLKQVSPKTSYEEMTEDDLANNLRRSSKEKRYLVYLDDIWNLEAWYSLKDSFPDDSKQSRMILTSLSHEMPDKEPVILSELSIEDSMELLQKRLFPGNAWPAELHDLGMKMAEKCKGLPLAIVVLAGVLANVEAEDWKKILDGFSFVSNVDYCKHTLELSHKHLPDYLKPCLLYFGAFPEDKEIEVKKLLHLWIGEGFVRKSETKSLEEVAEDYLRVLIGRSLVMAAERRSDGGVKTCRIHDLLRDFFLQQSRDEHFFHSLKGHDELVSFNEPNNLRRLWIESEPEHIKRSKLICSRARSFHLSSSQESRSLYRGISGMLHFCKLLKVLDLSQIRVPKFPSGVRQLVLLAFLAINLEYVRDIPSWIDGLSRLESFIIIHHHKGISFPDSLWNLQKLKYLYTSITHLGSGSLPRGNLENSPVLYELDRISGAAIHWGSMGRQLRKFPNVRKLKCMLVLDEEDDTNTEYPDKFVFPDFLTDLKHLPC